MGLNAIFKEHLSPFDQTKQWPDDTFQNNMCGIAGLTLIGTASIGYSFFKMAPATAGILAGGGSGLMLSYLTEKDGYAYLVGIFAATWLAAQTVDAIQSGRMIVHLDLAEIIKVVGNLLKTPPKAPAY